MNGIYLKTILRPGKPDKSGYLCDDMPPQLRITGRGRTVIQMGGGRGGAKTGWRIRDLDKLYELWAAGKNMHEIAREMGREYEDVKNRVRAEGLE